MNLGLLLIRYRRTCALHVQYIAAPVDHGICFSGTSFRI